MQVQQDWTGDSASGEGVWGLKLMRDARATAIAAAESGVGIWDWIELTEH
jgi:hypothetical protein